jgi:GAF domain-containing protein
VSRRHLPQLIDSERQLTSLMSMVAAVQPEFDRSVQRIAEWGLAALPAADGVGVALLQDGRIDHLAATAPFVAEIDDAQHGTMEGPCVTAMRENRTVVVGSLTAEERWPALRGEISQVGVHSALSIPLTVSEHLIGSLNAYARKPEAFDPSLAFRGGKLAEPAAVALQEACLAREARSVTERLGAAVERRRTLNRTVGLLMAQDGVEAAEARATVETPGRARGQRLETVAQAIWEARIESANPARSDATVSPLRP